MTHAMLPLKARALLFALLVLSPAGAAAQQDSVAVRGRITGADSSPVEGQRVVLHRVAGGEGATVSSTTTSATGEFVLHAPVQADTSAVYFAATLYDGELYIGPAFRPEQAELIVHDIQVGVPGQSATALMEGAGQGAGMPTPVGRPATNRNWLLLLIPLLGVAAVAVYALVPRNRIAPDRALLIRIAELDERMETAPPAQRENLAAERSRLVMQLREGE